MKEQQILLLKNKGLRIIDIARRLGISHQLVTYYLNKKQKNRKQHEKFMKKPLSERKKIYKKYKDYRTEYYNKRYNEDEEFREKRKKQSREYYKKKVEQQLKGGKITNERK